MSYHIDSPQCSLSCKDGQLTCRAKFFFQERVGRKGQGRIFTGETGRVVVVTLSIPNMPEVELKTLHLTTPAVVPAPQKLAAFNEVAEPMFKSIPWELDATKPKNSPNSVTGCCRC